MCKIAVITVLVSCALIICTSCDKEPKENFVGIEGISFENYPIVDGSTSARALNMMVACKLLNVRYDWQSMFPPESLVNMEWNVVPNMKDVPKQFENNFFGSRIKTSQTHGAFMNLINGNHSHIPRNVKANKKNF